MPDITGIFHWALYRKSLAYLPILIESSFTFLANMFGPDGLQGAQTPGSFDVSDDTHDDNRGSLENGDALDHFLLVNLRARPVDIADNVSHTRLIAHEAGEVDGFGSIILWEALNLAS